MGNQILLSTAGSLAVSFLPAVASQLSTPGEVLFGELRRDGDLGELLPSLVTSV